ncbi:restriction endonuclease subunit S [Mycoplasma anatis]|uniref:restriction endonuclease subunit S n=1 Tax=Mycoplasmopsis anatis TaxID=171279 RepID=UPI001C4F6025|nr:restriction endonuclease subunit S [Mycoplasmopsis anatis]MBW0599108.1 restriction endonuclease subunit S [Mycoplasmopsis anatis]MBW0599793.1 restriction endonuclease subunit S [Mycoplasmopsis anatis]
MNKIWDLIKNEKVEWKSLGEIGVITGAGVDKKINDNEKFVTLLNYMDVYKNKYIDSLIPRMRVTASDKKIISCNVKKGDIFITPSSETKYDIFNTSVIAQDLRNTVYSYHIMRLRLKTYNWITSCYLNYYFDSQKFKEEIYKLVHGEIRFTISKSDIEKIKIPIPSIDTQNKIVKILDKFNIYVKELERELERRNKQYQHYRDMLLSENYLNSNCRNNLMNVDREIKWKKLGEFCEIGTGSSNRKDEVSDGMYPFFVRSKNILRSNKYEFDETAIIIPGEGGIGEIFHFIEGKYSLHQRAYRIKVLDTNINTKFIYHYLTNWFKEYILNIAVGATAASIRKPMIEDFEIPIPSLDIQNRIVKILDKFSELSENTKGLLPKEIQQRQEQYKYYRDKLLVFDNTHNPERERERERRCGTTK